VAATSSPSDTSSLDLQLAPSGAGSVSAALRAQLTTTPGRLRMIAAALVAAATLLGLSVWGAERSRANAANAVATQTEPLLREATNLYASLSDADATITSTFVKGGLEPRLSRNRYVSDLAAATSELAALAKQVRGNPRATAAIATIGSQLPIYNGYVEAARADNRKQLPLGAAYLRKASELMRTQILPFGGSLFSIEAASLGGDYATGGDDGALAAFVIGMLVLLAMFVAAQVYLSRITKRTFNVPLVLATVALLVLAVWGTAGLLSEQSSLSSARSAGSDGVEVLAATRILALRAQRDESLALVARDGGESSDLSAVTATLSPSGKLLAEAGAVAGRTGTTAQERAMAADLGSYLAAQDHVKSLYANGLVPAALTAAPAEAALSDKLNAALKAQIDVAQRRFANSASDATSALSGLSVAIPLLTALAAVLVLIGFRPRINEYR
jgi:hypothetical protein